VTAVVSCAIGGLPCRPGLREYQPPPGSCLGHCHCPGFGEGHPLPPLLLEHEADEGGGISHAGMVPSGMIGRVDEGEPRRTERTGPKMGVKTLAVLGAVVVTSLALAAAAPAQPGTALCWTKRVGNVVGQATKYSRATSCGLAKNTGRKAVNFQRPRRTCRARRLRVRSPVTRRTYLLRRRVPSRWRRGRSCFYVARGANNSEIAVLVTVRVR
jgi:hypothetical protein